MVRRKNTNKSIFVSSTFRDMQAERDALRDHTLPKVNEFAARYGRAVELIDLRWGVDTASVTEEEQNHKVLRTCLDEINRSRPFFLGLIGDRYGWVPPDADMARALEAMEFPMYDLNKSVTALEIEYGALRSDKPPICLFYFRESPDYDKLPEETHRIYRDDEIGLHRLESLKKEVRTRFGSDVKEYAPLISGRGLDVSDEWSGMVATDIIDKLREEWGEPDNETADWRERELGIQNSFRENRTAHFVGREAAIAKLRNFRAVEDTPNFLALQGEAGSGKSGLLCKVMDEIEGECLLLPFCCGLSPRLSQTQGMLRLFIRILCTYLRLVDDSESMTNLSDVKARFVELVYLACENTQVVIIIDALDQMEDHEEIDKLLIELKKAPRNLRLLCSILSDGDRNENIIRVFKSLDGRIIDVPRISDADAAAMLQFLAAKRHKQIASDIIEYVLKKNPTSGSPQISQNPLFLSLIIQDFAMIDRYELAVVEQYMADGMKQPEALSKLMRQRIDSIPGDVEGAYMAILNRLEQLMGRDFVRAAVGLIAVSRIGLRECDLAGVFAKLSIPFNPADFSWLRQMLRGHLSQGRFLQWNFSHQTMRRALWRHREEELKRLNLGLSEWFLDCQKNMDELAVQEVMYHLNVAERPDTAAIIIAEHFDTNRDAYARYLAGGQSFHHDDFVFAIPKSANGVEPCQRWKIAELFRVLFVTYSQKKYDKKIIIEASIDMLEQIAEAVPDAWRYIALCNMSLGDLDMEDGDHQSAFPCYKKVYEAFDAVYATDSADEYGEDFAASCIRMGDGTSLFGLPEAAVYYEKALSLYDRLYKRDSKEDSLRSLAVCRAKLSQLLADCYEPEKARAYHEESLEAYRRLYELTGTDRSLRDWLVSYGEMGDFLISAGQSEGADGYYRDSVAGLERLYAQSGSVVDLGALRDMCGRMAGYLTARNQMDAAAEYCNKMDKAAVQCVLRSNYSDNSKIGLSLSAVKKGDWLAAGGKIEEARQYYEAALSYADKNIMESLVHRQRGDRHAKAGFVEDARKEREKADEIFHNCFYNSAVLRNRILASVFEKLGDLSRDAGETEESDRYYGYSVDIFSKQVLIRVSSEMPGYSGAAIKDYRLLAAAHIKLGNNLRNRGVDKQSYRNYTEALSSLMKAYDGSSLVQDLRALAAVYESLKDFVGVWVQAEKDEAAADAGKYASEDFAQVILGKGSAPALRALTKSRYSYTIENVSEYLQKLEQIERSDAEKQSRKPPASAGKADAVNNTPRGDKDKAPGAKSFWSRFRKK